MKYIDTSAFVKHFGDPEVEKGAERVSDIISQAQRGDFVLISSFFDDW